MLNDNAEFIFNKKYARTINNRKEKWNETISRVADYISNAETNDSNKYRMMAFYIEAMLDMDFLPGGRILANSGTKVKNLMNCFVLPVGDSRDEIYTTLKQAAEILTYGGGVGYNFSRLRPEGSLISTINGKASGPLNFMTIFDQTGEVISQASRRGAQIAILNIDHPDILKFINFKSCLNKKNTRLVEEYLKNLAKAGLNTNSSKYFDIMRKTLADDQLIHFNLSVGMTDKFMGDDYPNNRLIDINGSQISSADLMNALAKSAWESGDPGVIFLDRINRDNLVPYLGEIEATNPCGEVPLLPYEACCLGSINLFNCIDSGDFDWDYFENLIRIAVRFLDSVHDMNESSIPEINNMCKSTRRLGLGIMGLADCLVELGLKYGSDESLDFCDKLAEFFGRTAWIASMDLAKEKGPFPAFDPDKMNWTLIDKFGLPRNPVRNIAVTSIAPTGSISLLAGVNSGIEPFFSTEFKRVILNEDKRMVVDFTLPLLEEKRIDYKWPEFLIKELFITSHEISWLDHLRMQATWQKWIDNAVSKTINLPEDSSIDDVKNIFIKAWELGCKGVTIYRYNSKSTQILNK